MISRMNTGGQKHSMFFDSGFIIMLEIPDDQGAWSTRKRVRGTNADEEILERCR